MDEDDKLSAGPRENSDEVIEIDQATDRNEVQE